MRAALLLLAAALAFPVSAAEVVDQAKLQKLYDEAFNQYNDGEYSRALKIWNEILTLDSEQKTARKMIADAREEIRRKNEEKVKALYGLVRQGRYEDALLPLQTLIEEDSSHPRFKALEALLGEIAAIVPAAPRRNKAWRMAILGLEGLVGRRKNPRLAYDGLRYALELAPEEERFKRLLELLLTRQPELAQSDSVTPGMTLLEYKRFVALNHIYEEKYHLAIEVLDEILALEPDDVVALKRLGSSYFWLGRAEKARQAWTRALELSPGDAPLMKSLKSLDGPRAPKEKP